MTVTSTISSETIDETPVFVDRFGHAHRLIPGYRSRIKPGWESMLGGKPGDRHRPGKRGRKDRAPDKRRHDYRERLEEVHGRVQLGLHMLDLIDAPLDGKDILVVGCDRGDEVAYLAAAGAGTVTGSNYGDSGAAESAHTAGGPNVLERACPDHSLLIEHLGALGALHPFRQAETSIVPDNIERSAFPDESFDIICSWRTLEHLTDPDAAFSHMFRLLRPGGVMFHEYNPFFCIDGGHSLVTLDFPWGHVVLDAGDVERYLELRRPDEKALALSFYRHHLNRMSISRMEAMARRAGFVIEALIPRARTEDLMEVTPEVLCAARRIYPYVTLNDLVCRVVRVVLRRPR